MTGSPEPAVGSTDQPHSGLEAVWTAVDDAGAVGFVHVGIRFDPSRRYLTRVDGPDRETALVVLPGTKNQPPQAVYCVPRGVASEVTAFEQSTSDSEISRQIEGRPPTTATGQQVRAVLADRLGTTVSDGTLLVPRTLPHDAAVFLQEAGYELQSTPAVTTARATKTSAERDCLRAVQAAAADGLARSEAVLAASEPVDGRLVVDGQPLTAERLRRQINTELAASGVAPADNTSIEADTDVAGRLPAGEPIRLTVSPRGPHGYHGHLTRTVAVDSEGGWERRAFIAAEAGLQAAQREIKPGVDVSTVQGEAVAEVGAYGFAVTPDTDQPTQGRATATVHGVGLSTHEQPAVGAESQLRAGAVIAVDTGVVDPARGTIRLGTLFVVSEEGPETLIEYPTSLTPVDRLN